MKVTATERAHSFGKPGFSCANTKRSEYAEKRTGRTKFSTSSARVAFRLWVLRDRETERGKTCQQHTGYSLVAHNITNRAWASESEPKARANERMCAQRAYRIQHKRFVASQLRPTNGEGKIIITNSLRDLQYWPIWGPVNWTNYNHIRVKCWKWSTRRKLVAMNYWTLNGELYNLKVATSSSSWTHHGEPANERRRATKIERTKSNPIEANADQDRLGKQQWDFKDQSRYKSGCQV